MKHKHWAAVAATVLAGAAIAAATLLFRAPGGEPGEPDSAGSTVNAPRKRVLPGDHGDGNAPGLRMSLRGRVPRDGGVGALPSRRNAELAGRVDLLRQRSEPVPRKWRLDAGRRR